MKLAIATAILAAFAPAALADLPAGFYEQCCVGDGDELEANAAASFLERRQLAKIDKLRGFDPSTGYIHPLCREPATRMGMAKGSWTCYTYKGVCENQGQYFAPNPPVTTTEICDNNANCYSPARSTSECIGEPSGFPDIWWSCVTYGVTAGLFGLANQRSFHCGFECKFTEACGDPHFETFDGKWFDFHGECDLVLLKAEEFGMGLGLDVHVRTKGRYEYSFIESAAIKIGDDILEVSSYGAYAFNGVSGADLSHAKFADMYSIEHEVKDAQTSEYTIRTGGNEFIKLKSFKDLVSVRTSNATAYNFGSSEGMMGDFFQGKMLARDGTTIIANADEFGQEWQVTESDPTLFQTPSPVAGKCIMPSERVSEGRRLGATVVNKEAAMKACNHVQGSKFDNCVYDVVATGDLESAKSY